MKVLTVKSKYDEMEAKLIEEKKNIRLKKRELALLIAQTNELEDEFNKLKELKNKYGLKSL